MSKHFELSLRAICHLLCAQALGSALSQAQLLKQQLDRTHLLSSESGRDRVGEWTVLWGGCHGVEQQSY